MSEGITVVYRNNTGGSNLRSNEVAINSGPERTEFYYIQNMELYRSGGFGSQRGNIQLNTGVTDNTAILGIGEYKTGGNTFAIYTKASGKAYIMPLSGGAETEIRTGLSTTAVPTFVNFNGKVICFNGVDMPWSWNGTIASTLSGTPTAWNTTKPQVAAVFSSTRIFAAAGNTIYFSALGNENDWTTQNDAGAIAGFFNDNAPVIAMTDYGRNLVLHTRKPGIYLISGTSPDNYAITPMASNRAATGKLGVTNIGDNQFFFTGDSINAVITTDLGFVRLGQGSEISRKIKPFITGTDEEMAIRAVDPANYPNVILLPNYLKNELIAYFSTTGASSYDVAAIYSLDDDSWVFRRASAITTAARVGEVIMTGTATGQILREFSGTAVVSGNLDKRLISPFFDFGSPGLRKQLTRFNLWFKSNQDLDIDLVIRTDYNTNVQLSEPIITQGVYGGGAYNFGDYGDANYSDVSVGIYEITPRLVGRSFQFELNTNTPDLDLRIIMFSLEYEPATVY